MEGIDVPSVSFERGVTGARYGTGRYVVSDGRFAVEALRRRTGHRLPAGWAGADLWYLVGRDGGARYWLEEVSHLSACDFPRRRDALAALSQGLALHGSPPG